MLIDEPPRTPEIDAAFERERAILVCATASSLGDSYCSLAWGIRLAAMCDPDAAAAVLRSEPTDVFTPRERALVAFRLAFSTVNDALGAIPDEALRNAAPVEVRSSVTYGR
jgi:hypothetical protein